MSASLCRAGVVNGTTEDAEAQYPLKQNGQDQDHLQPEILAQETLDVVVRKKNKHGDAAQAGGVVQRPRTPSSPVGNGSHPTLKVCQSGQRHPCSTSSESREGSPNSVNTQVVAQRPDANGDHEPKDKIHRRKGLPTPLDLRETMANGLGILLSPASTNVKLSQIPEETSKRRSSQVDSPAMQGPEKEKILKLSPAQIQELTSSPKSLPLFTAPEESEKFPTNPLSDVCRALNRASAQTSSDISAGTGGLQHAQSRKRAGSAVVSSSTFKISDSRGVVPLLPAAETATSTSVSSRPGALSRTVSTPTNLRRKHPVPKQNGAIPISTPQTRSSRTSPSPLQLDDSKATLKPTVTPDPMPSPMPMSIPMPPLSIPTYLQLELSSDRPSPLYIHRSVTSDFPYESSRVTLERLQNFLLLPPQLEQVLWFGALACLDAWLYSFTILPLRFLKALYILGQSWGHNLVLEFRFVSGIIFAGTGRMWRRRRRGKDGPALTEPPARAAEQANFRKTSLSSFSTQQAATGSDSANGKHSYPETERKQRRGSAFKHRRTKSTPSALMPDHKADILKGLLVLFSCSVLMYFDASRMYHSIRGQAAIKLYVIYNVLEVCDRLFSALGQDVFECLFSKESLERKPDGRSKILRPFWLFVLALFYNVVHATALFYQVITLNVAVNSYSNALLTLLMSNQFVEIKSTVFKKFEKENLFQLTCADVVERFQLWLMLIIIASRNIVETGGLTITLSGLGGSLGSVVGQGANASLRLKASSILPKSFTIFPKWTGQVMGPFLLVLGSEMLVDWLKHAYITKFNNTKPAIYGRFLDVLAKDYYSNAFADQNLTRRLGLPVIPLSCLFIRASVQTYHMFLATHMPLPVPSTARSLSVETHATAPPVTTAALQHIDHYFRRALGRSSFGTGSVSSHPGTWWSTDDIIAFLTMAVFFLVLFLVLLACKLVLGMCLLSFARRRYKGMKEREKQSVHAEGRRVGGWGVVEVDEDKRRWIYQDDPDGARKLRGREAAVREKEGRGELVLGGVSRYNMVAKRIW